MKFLKPDGTIEDGQPLTEQQALLREGLEEYLHSTIRKHAYHANYEAHPCRQVANFLTITVQQIKIDEGELLQLIADEIERCKPKLRHPVEQPEPEVMAMPDRVTSAKEMF